MTAHSDRMTTDSDERMDVMGEYLARLTVRAICFDGDQGGRVLFFSDHATWGGSRSSARVRVRMPGGDGTRWTSRVHGDGCRYARESR